MKPQCAAQGDEDPVSALSRPGLSWWTQWSSERLGWRVTRFGSDVAKFTQHKFELLVESLGGHETPLEDSLASVRDGETTIRLAMKIA